MCVYVHEGKVDIFISFWVSNETSAAQLKWKFKAQCIIKIFLKARPFGPAQKTGENILYETYKENNIY